MTKKLILPALVLMFAALCTTNGLAQTCSGFTGTNVQYMGVGSSAQFNSFSFAAEDILNNAGNGFNFWASSSVPLQDTRITTTTVEDSAKVWIAWDNSSDCKLYAYFSVDSTVGVKSFFSWRKQTQNGVTNAIAAAVFVPSGTTLNGSSSCSTVGQVVNAGQPGCTTTTLPTTIQTWLEATPGPTCKIGTGGCTATTVGALPYPYCGQKSTTQTIAKYCYFNAGHADIRPEDTLYANARALSAYNSTAGEAGLGYNNTACGANSTGTLGCEFWESFGSSPGHFNVVKFGLTGTDPITLATLPAYESLNIGAVPVVVIASNADSAGLGATSGGNYEINNVNRAVLSGIESGTFGCTGDLRYDGSGAGKPLQVIHREALSGTYNTFEFTGVRTLSGSAPLAISPNKQTTLTWYTNDDSSQEVLNGDVTGCTTGTEGPSCNYNNGSTCVPGSDPTGRCGDPLYVNGPSCGGSPSLHVRAIGTGDMVKAVAGALTGQTVPDAFGYSFWGYGNLAPMGSGCSGTNTGNVTCSSFLAHYLTVDGIDPLFTNPGGAVGTAPDLNPNGAYNPPECYLKSGTPECAPIPFTHIKDGSYPLWSILRMVTFSTVTTGTAQQTTPAAVLQILAEAENVAGDSTKNLDDFVPYLTNINTPTDTTGDLNLFVLRSHRKQSPNTTAPNNGIAACGGTYTGILISGAAGTCTVDVGSDLGGAVITVNADEDFHTDYNGVGTDPSEYFGLLQ